jgi:DNA-binding transcriptional LysR family regulator
MEQHWNMDKFNLMTVFAAVAEEESFAGAGRRLGMSPPAVTRAIAALEDQLQIKLFTRTTRYVRVTDLGQRYLENVRRILSEVAEADEAIRTTNTTPRGLLHITAPVLFGNLLVTPVMVKYLKCYSEVQISALFLDRNVNLLEEGIDVGIRIGELPDSSMYAIRIGEVRRVLCASPRYLQTHGTPQHPSDLSQHTLIVANRMSKLTKEWNFDINKQNIATKITPRLTVTSNDAAIRAATQGFGITRVLSYQVGHHILNDDLNTILTEFEPPALPIHIIHREGRYKSAKIRSFIDFMVEHFKNNHPF